MRKMMTGLAILIFSIILAAGSVIYQDRKALRCDYDGTRIIPVYGIDIMLKDGENMNFCSVHCAWEWSRKNRSRIDSVMVTDEITGERLDASLAYYVESDVVTVRAVQNRTHVFKEKTDALAHAGQHNGNMIDNPFNQQTDK